jgi:hypothetical protein
MNKEKLKTELEVLKRIDHQKSQEVNILQYLSSTMLERLLEFQLRESEPSEESLNALMVDIEKEVLYFKIHGKHMEYENE